MGRNNISALFKNDRELDEASILFKTQLKCTFLFSFLFLFLFHLARYGNLAYTGDSLIMLQDAHASLPISVGRWGQVFYWKFRGSISIPYLIGVLTALYISIAAFMIVRMMNIQKPVFIAMLCMFMTGSEALTSLNASFIGDTDAYICSMMLAVISVYLWSHDGPWFLLSSFFIGASVSIYQADVQTALELMIIFMILKLLKGEHFKFLLIQLGKGITFFGFGAIVYWAGSQWTLHHYEVEAEEDIVSSSFHLLNNLNFNNLLSRFTDAWKMPFDFLVTPRASNPTITSILYILIIAVSLFLIAYKIIQNKVNKSYL